MASPKSCKPTYAYYGLLSEHNKFHCSYWMQDKYGNMFS
jgi:hypothetical protein